MRGPADAGASRTAMASRGASRGASQQQRITWRVAVGQGVGGQLVQVALLVDHGPVLALRVPQLDARVVHPGAGLLRRVPDAHHQGARLGQLLGQHGLAAGRAPDLAAQRRGWQVGGGGRGRGSQRNGNRRQQETGVAHPGGLHRGRGSPARQCLQAGWARAHRRWGTAPPAAPKPGPLKSCRCVLRLRSPHAMPYSPLHG